MKTIVPFRFLILVAWTELLTGCVTSEARIESLGVKVGDHLKLEIDAVTYSCKPEVSSAGLWFGAKEASCLGRSADSSKPFSNYSGQREFVVDKIVLTNGVDNVGHWARVSAGNQSFWVHDFDIAELFGQGHKS